MSENSRVFSWRFPSFVFFFFLSKHSPHFLRVSITDSSDSCLSESCAAMRYAVRKSNTHYANMAFMKEKANDSLVMSSIQKGCIAPADYLISV